VKELPIACTLGARDRADREAFIARLWRDALIAGERTGDGVRLRLRDDPEVETRARELIAAEQSCCAFLSFELARSDDELVLQITGPPDARPIVDAFLTGEPIP
jgi:hypothetical protein